MLSKLATLALIGVAAAATYEAETDEEIEAWSLSGTNDDNVDATSRLIARVEAIEYAADPTTSGVQLAQTSMGRLDAIVNEVAELKMQLATDLTGLTNTAGLTGSANGLEWHKDRVITKKWEIRNKGRESRKAILAKINAAKAKVGIKAAQIEENVTPIFEEMEANIDHEMTKLLGNAVFVGTDEHIKQVTGFSPDEVDKYWDGAVLTSTADNAEVKGRKFYKVKFNAKQPGFFTSGADELFMACRALSVYMQRTDGIERDLRPACNHYNHQRLGGLGQCIWISRSYFSHCGGGGYWRQNEACGGIEEPKLRMTVMYETNQHNWDRQYAHHDRANGHGWVDPYKASAYQSTLCTGGNQNYKLDFKK